MNSNDEIIQTVKNNVDRMNTLEELCRGNNKNLNALFDHVLGQGERKGLMFRVADLEQYKETINENLKFIKRGILSAIIVLSVSAIWGQYSRNNDFEHLKLQIKQLEQDRNGNAAEALRRLEKRLEEVIKEKGK